MQYKKKVPQKQFILMITEISNNIQLQFSNNKASSTRAMSKIESFLFIWEKRRRRKWIAASNNKKMSKNDHFSLLQLLLIISSTQCHDHKKQLFNFDYVTYTQPDHPFLLFGSLHCACNSYKRISKCIAKLILYCKKITFSVLWFFFAP